MLMMSSAGRFPSVEEIFRYASGKQRRLGGRSEDDSSPWPCSPGDFSPKQRELVVGTTLLTPPELSEDIPPPLEHEETLPPPPDVMPRPLADPSMPPAA